MKTKNWILFVLAIAFATNVFATKTPKMNIIALENSKALIAAEKAKPEKSVITIEAEDGYIVYFKETSNQSDEFKTIFDLSNLEDGGYTVKFKTGNALVKRNVNISNGKISVTDMRTEYEPVFAQEGNVLKISYLNIEGGDMSLLFYTNGEYVCEKALGKDFKLQRGFDLSELKQGEYEVNLVASDEDYWFSVKR